MTGDPVRASAAVPAASARVSAGDRAPSLGLRVEAMEPAAARAPVQAQEPVRELVLVQVRVVRDRVRAKVPVQAPVLAAPGLGPD